MRGRKDLSVGRGHLVGGRRKRSGGERLFGNHGRSSRHSWRVGRSSSSRSRSSRISSIRSIGRSIGRSSSSSSSSSRSIRIGRSSSSSRSRSIRIGRHTRKSDDAERADDVGNNGPKDNKHPEGKNRRVALLTESEFFPRAALKHEGRSGPDNDGNTENINSERKPQDVHF